MIFFFSCKSSEEISNQVRLNLVNNGHSISVFNRERIGQLVCDESFIVEESIYYDKDFNILSSSRKSILYPNYLEIFDRNENYIGNVRIIKTFINGKDVFVIVINDIESSITYITNSFSDFSRPIFIYKEKNKISTIRNYGNKKWSISIYNSGIDANLLIHMFKFIRNDRFSNTLK